MDFWIAAPPLQAKYFPPLQKNLSQKFKESLYFSVPVLTIFEILVKESYGYPPPPFEVEKYILIIFSNRVVRVVGQIAK